MGGQSLETVGTSSPTISLNAATQVFKSYKEGRAGGTELLGPCGLSHLQLCQIKKGSVKFLTGLKCVKVHLTSFKEEG